MLTNSRERIFKEASSCQFGSLRVSSSMGTLCRFCLALVGLVVVQSATTEKGCGTNPADIQFLLDSSGSVGSGNFQKQLNFVKTFADSFTIGPSAVQIGVTTFSTSVHNEFWLNQHPTKAALKAAVSRIRYVGGNTQTGKALDFIRQNAFTHAHGDRDKVANILIVVTDGRSSNHADMLRAATAIHKQNMNIFAIGVGSGISQSELREIASNPHNVFTVTGFSALHQLQATLKKTTCKVDGKWGKWGFYSPCTKSCGGGTKYRVRSCNDPPPAHGGKNCVGNAKETVKCNTKPCPTTPKPTTTPKPVTHKITHKPTTRITTPATTLAAGCGIQPVDLLFLLDASGSVGDSNFQKMLKFVQSMVQGFDISPNATQVGVVSFDTKPYLQFHLNKYHNKAGVLNAIKHIRYTKGNTYTHLALQYARNTMLTAANGARPNAAKVAIIITDGKSNNPPATTTEARNLRNHGVTIFSIGVGSGPKQSELQAMATDPDKDHVFIVTNFDALKLIKGSLQQKTCNVKATVVSATPKPSKPDCGAEADIVFLLDESGSVGSSNFNKMKKFVEDFAKTFTIGPNGVQIGVDTFSSAPHKQFDLKTYHTGADVAAAVSRIKYLGGGTSTGVAIRYMKNSSFTAAAGLRHNVPHIAIVVTDGQSNNKALTKAEAAKLKSSGVKVLALGIGNGINDQELKDIASDPDSQYVYKAATFDALASLKGVMSSKACEVAKPKPNTHPLPANCGAKADIVFLLDSSGSVGSKNFNSLLSFVKSVIQPLPVSQGQIRVGVEKFSSRPYTEFHLNKHPDKQSVLHAVDHVKYVAGGTNTGDAIRFMVDNMFNQKNGDRPGVPNIGIIVTDGRSAKPDDTKAQASLARKKGINLFSVGVGSGISVKELDAIATDPDKDHVLTVKDFGKLAGISALFTQKACQAIPPTLPPYIPKPVTTLSPDLDTCQDGQPNCDEYASDICTTFSQWAHTNCARHCGFCTTSIPTVPPPCEDKLPNCKSFAPTSCTAKYAHWAKENCRKFCGYCVPSTLTGYFGKCYYNGAEYRQGDKWTDGCQYECECIDESRGKYQCFNRCPAYYNLPPQCTLVRVAGECCLKPVCDFKGVYQISTGQNAGKLHGVNVCVYNGGKYYQGQTWQVGCEFKCMCKDSTVGLWSCQSVCGHYGSLPSGCKMQKKPGECCEKPVCNFHTQYGAFTGKGTVSGPGDKTTSPTTPPPCVDVLPNCGAYDQNTCVAKQFREWAMANCRKHCNLCTAAVLPGPNDFCLYKGTKYTQGQRWTDGCNGECICENAKYGYYRCNDQCPKYYNTPPSCQLVKIPGQCCKFLQCPGGTFVGSQTLPGTIGGYPVPIPMINPTPAPGHTYAPGQIPTQSPYPVPQKLNGCMYKGTLYKQGQQWHDSCQYSCSCEDGVSGRFRCSPRCAKFNNLPTGCVLKDTPADPCCQVPDCSSAGHNVVVVPNYGPAFTGYGPVTYPVGSGVYPGMGGYGTLPPVHAGTNPPLTGTRIGCSYKGVIHQQGQKWTDGCQYNCECMDGVTGLYRCTEICPKYQNLPPQCHLIPDPKNSCCQTYTCNFNQQITTLPPLFALTTPLPGQDFCVYRGYYYHQGEEWKDGCSLTCRCEDARNNYHQCTDRCAKFTSIPLGCRMVPDPQDPLCCKVPECDSAHIGPGGVVNGNYQPLGFIGSFVGYGRPPNSNVGLNAGYRNACIYKGNIHQQGTTWHDGCKYDCECTNAMTGQYRCTDRCPRYAALPQGCTLITDPNDRCCLKAECAPPAVLTTNSPSGVFTPGTGTGTSTCQDKLQNCYLYGKWSCKDPYTKWAKDNCAKFCGFCGGSTVNEPCRDRLPNCDSYGPDGCVGNYRAWAEYNCRKHCGFCGQSQVPKTTAAPIPIIGHPTPISGSGNQNCHDKITNCNTYSKDACHDPYLQWAKTNCAKYCGLCDQLTSGGTVGGSGVTGPSGNQHGGGFSFFTEYPIDAFTGRNTGCYYKGRIYKQSEKWQDGCEYNCTCTNGQTGYYTCISRCQTYSNLPAGCTLKKAPGDCCAKPDCTAQHVGTGGSGTGCLYKGKIYHQNEKWSDGCDFTCTCTDEQSSKYQCRQKCIVWQLPPVCTLNQPAPGKCCKTPNCPKGIVINYPPGYIEE